MKQGEQAVRKFQRKEEVAREGRQGLFPTCSHVWACGDLSERASTDLPVKAKNVGEEIFSGQKCSLLHLVAQFQVKRMRPWR